MSRSRFTTLIPLRLALSRGSPRLAPVALLGALLSVVAPPTVAQISAAQSTTVAVQKLWADTLPDASGAPQALVRYRGQPVVINFWASWCGPCVQEMPALSSLSQQYAAKGIQFIGIGIDSAANITAFLNKVPVKYPVYVAGFGGAEITRSFGNNVGGLPFTVVVDRAGSVRYSKLGKVDEIELKRILARL
jgi:thiol-disulfide isomerase/thioredoxin